MRGWIHTDSELQNTVMGFVIWILFLCSLVLWGDFVSDVAYGFVMGRIWMLMVLDSHECIWMHTDGRCIRMFDICIGSASSVATKQADER